MRINCCNVRLITLLILDVLLKVVLCIAFITLRFNITLLFFYKNRIREFV
jgi:hypothetical protein